MVIYALFLQVKGSEEKYRYALDLTYDQENKPEGVFTPEIRGRMRKYFQEKTLCEIKALHLDKMIENWLEDIKEGQRASTITLDLPLLIEANVYHLNEQGNQDKPRLISPKLSEVEPRAGMLPPLNFS